MTDWVQSTNQLKLTLTEQPWLIGWALKNLVPWFVAPVIFS